MASVSPLQPATRKPRGTETAFDVSPGVAEPTVMLYSPFSKKFAMTGWRLGCAAAPIEVAQMITKINTNEESCMIGSAS